MCSNEINITPDTKLEYGTSFGMCVGYCVKTMEITDSKILFSATSRIEEDEDKVIEQKSTREEFEKVLNSLNLDEFRSLPDIIGCPDCADGGAEFITLVYEGEEKTVTFEYGDDLENQNEALRILRKKFKELNDSVFPVD
jgi:hypothetical protein